MSDLYTEVLVKKQQTGKDKVIKGVLIFFTVLFAAAGIMMNPLILLLALVLGIVDYIFIPKLSVEFEGRAGPRHRRKGAGADQEHRGREKDHLPDGDPQYASGTGTGQPHPDDGRWAHRV